MTIKKEVHLCEPKFTHIMLDGTVRDSIDGMVIPVNENTEVVYRMLAESVKKESQAKGA